MQKSTSKKRGKGEGTTEKFYEPGRNSTVVEGKTTEKKETRYARKRLLKMKKDYLKCFPRDVTFEKFIFPQTTMVSALKNYYYFIF